MCPLVSKKRKIRISDLFNYSNYDILQWLKLSKETHPVLARMEKDYLSIIPASVASERSFSVGGQKISKDRCNSHTETARELMCVKSWMKFKFEKSD
jgi:hypothetical protein